MPVEISDRTVKQDFIEKVKKLSGQDIGKCFQCGTCGGACPMSGHMEVMPRKIMRMAQLGLEEMAKAPNTCWTCASCHACTVNCPRGIDLAKVMEALRLLILRKNVNFVEPSRMSEKIMRETPQIVMVGGFRKMTC